MNPRKVELESNIELSDFKETPNELLPTGLHGLTSVESELSGNLPGSMELSDFNPGESELEELYGFTLLDIESPEADVSIKPHNFTPAKPESPKQLHDLPIDLICSIFDLQSDHDRLSFYVALHNTMVAFKYPRRLKDYYSNLLPRNNEDTIQYLQWLYSERTQATSSVATMIAGYKNEIENELRQYVIEDRCKGSGKLAGKYFYKQMAVSFFSNSKNEVVAGEEDRQYFNKGSAGANTYFRVLKKIAAIENINDLKLFSSFLDKTANELRDGKLRKRISLCKNKCDQFISEFDATINNFNNGKRQRAIQIAIDIAFDRLIKKLDEAIKEHGTKEEKERVIEKEVRLKYRALCKEYEEAVANKNQLHDRFNESRKTHLLRPRQVSSDNAFYIDVAKTDLRKGYPNIDFNVEEEEKEKTMEEKLQRILQDDKAFSDLANKLSPSEIEVKAAFRM